MKLAALSMQAWTPWTHIMVCQPISIALEMTPLSPHGFLYHFQMFECSATRICSQAFQGNMLETPDMKKKRCRNITSMSLIEESSFSNYIYTNTIARYILCKSVLEIVSNMDTQFHLGTGRFDHTSSDQK